MSLRHTIRSLLNGPQAQEQQGQHHPGPQGNYGYPTHQAPFPTHSYGLGVASIGAGPSPYHASPYQQPYGYAPPPGPPVQQPQAYPSYEYQQHQQQQQHQHHQQHQQHQQHYHYDHGQNQYQHQQQYQQQQQQQQPQYQPHYQQPQGYHHQQPQNSYAQNTPTYQYQSHPEPPPVAAPPVHMHAPTPAPAPAPQPQPQQAQTHYGAVPSAPSATNFNQEVPSAPSQEYFNAPHHEQAYSQSIPTSPPPPYSHTPQQTQSTFTSQIAQPAAPSAETPSSQPLSPSTAASHPPSLQPGAQQHSPKTSSPVQKPAAVDSTPARQEQPPKSPLGPVKQPQVAYQTDHSHDVFTPVSPNPQQAQFEPHTTSFPPEKQKPVDTVPEPLSSPSGIIHPSMLVQWTAATKMQSTPAPTTPTTQRPPPSPASPSWPKQHAAPSQQPHLGHKHTVSVNRSMTFPKKNADGSPNWTGILITIDGLPSETFTRFVDGIYNYAGQEDDPLGLTPDQIRVLFERMEMPDQDNHPRRLALIAQKNQHPDPVNFVNTSMIQCYTVFDLTYITEANLMPIITREGFQQYMITMVLVDPSAMHVRFNRLLAKFGHQIIDPPTKKPFGGIQVNRQCYPAAPNDQYASRNRKQREALESREENSGDGNGGQGSSSSDSRPQYGHQSSWGR